jgi:hypothetical protein
VVKLLKIKDNIDLKKLEKYGFVKVRNTYEFNKGDSGLIVYNKNRAIANYNCNTDVLTVLYDLIKADLVEKVGY